MWSCWFIETVVVAVTGVVVMVIVLMTTIESKPTSPSPQQHTLSHTPLLHFAPANANTKYTQGVRNIPGGEQKPELRNTPRGEIALGHTHA